MSARSVDLYNITPMAINDLDKVYELELASYSFPWTKEILRDCILYNYNSFSVFFNNELIGYIISKIACPETHILNLTVNTAFRRKGIGQSLINLVINDAKIRKSEDIILEVRASNHEAQALYHKLNFKSIGIRRGYYESENDREDAYVLKLSL